MRRTSLGLSLAALLLLLGTVGRASDAWLHEPLVHWFGPPHVDLSLDHLGESTTATVMSRYDGGDGPIVSYEYAIGGELFVGYQRSPVPWHLELRPFDEIDIDYLPRSPRMSRVAGTRRHPLSGITVQWRRSSRVRFAIDAALIAAGLLLAALTLARRARAR
jgi:hypothetical protein